MGNKFIIGSFFSKNSKKIELLAFNNKIKIIKAFVPDKVKLYINSSLSKELNYFQKKYSFKIDLIEEAQLIIPEYKIELLNKSKKIIDKIINVKEIKSFKPTMVKSDNKSQKIDKKNQKVVTKSLKEKSFLKKIKKPRTLWVRKKKAS